MKIINLIFSLNQPLIFHTVLHEVMSKFTGCILKHWLTFETLFHFYINKNIYIIFIYFQNKDLIYAIYRLLVIT